MSFFVYDCAGAKRRQLTCDIFIKDSWIVSINSLEVQAGGKDTTFDEDIFFNIGHSLMDSLKQGIVNASCSEQEFIEYLIRL